MRTVTLLRRSVAASIATAIFLSVATLSVSPSAAMPLESFSRGEPGLQITGQGRVDIKEVRDESTAMEIRLSKQIMALQTQIDELRAEVEELKREE